MRAYKISCSDDDHGQIIVFAERSKDVDRRSNSDTCDCEYINRRVNRFPQFDKYSPGLVTIENYLAEGWYWSCCGCEKTVTQDDAPIIENDSVFCSAYCAEQYLERIKTFTHESFNQSRMAAEQIVAARGPKGVGK